MHTGTIYDCHAHTPDLSYCCDQAVTLELYAAALERHPELAGIAITNHGFGTYFPSDLAWSASYMSNPEIFDDFREFGNRRLEQHLSTLASYRDRGLFPGLEVEMMQDGRLTFDERFRPRLAVIIGSVHFLPWLGATCHAPEQFVEAWWHHTEELAGTGIDILAHPFRWLHKTLRAAISNEMIDRMVSLAAVRHIALEINAHTHIPGDLEMLQACARRKVRVAFGSDSHAIDELARLDYQMNLMKQAGLTPADLVLWAPRRCSG